MNLLISQSGHELLDQRVDRVRNLGGWEVPRAGELASRSTTTLVTRAFAK